MSTAEFEKVIEDLKYIMLPALEKHGDDTEKLSAFIEEMTALYQKHHDNGLPLNDSCYALSKISMTVMIRLGNVAPARDFALYMRDYGDRAIKQIDQHN
ncbi:MAG: hypothetical protein COC24_018825 [Alphaproteobacteria bacterium]|nr:hypothetical protein [Alphaproteobacteria bacterium]